MERLRVKQLGWAAAAGLAVLSLATTPAQANHEPDIVVPVVTAFALGALWSHGHGGHYYSHGYRYQRHGHHRGGHYRHGYSHKRQYSYSRGGYSHGYGHKGNYRPGRSDFGHSRGHGSKRGRHGGPKHRH
jgi:hypothetical protein